MQAALVRVGNSSFPTAPLGAVPLQLVPFDQFGSPMGAPPLHVKSAAVAERAVSRTTDGPSTSTIVSTRTRDCTNPHRNRDRLARLSFRVLWVAAGRVPHPPVYRVVLIRAG